MPEDWCMPDSAYDADKHPGYFALHRTSKEFHAFLKSRMEGYGSNNTILDTDHFDKAQSELITILIERNKKWSDLVRQAVGELILVIGGICASPIIVEYTIPSPKIRR